MNIKSAVSNFYEARTQERLHGQFQFQERVSHESLHRKQFAFESLRFLGRAFSDLMHGVLTGIVKLTARTESSIPSHCFQQAASDLLTVAQCGLGMLAPDRAAKQALSDESFRSRSNQALMAQFLDQQVHKIMSQAGELIASRAEDIVNATAGLGGRLTRTPEGVAAVAAQRLEREIYSHLTKKYSTTSIYKSLEERKFKLDPRHLQFRSMTRYMCPRMQAELERRFEDPSYQQQPDALSGAEQGIAAVLSQAVEKEVRWALVEASSGDSDFREQEFRKSDLEARRIRAQFNFQSSLRAINKVVTLPTLRVGDGV